MLVAARAPSAISTTTTPRFHGNPITAPARATRRRRRRRRN